jgi:hypothetical protein
VNLEEWMDMDTLGWYYQEQGNLCYGVKMLGEVRGFVLFGKRKSNVGLSKKVKKKKVKKRKRK